MTCLALEPLHEAGLGLAEPNHALPQVHLVQGPVGGYDRCCLVQQPQCRWRQHQTPPPSPAPSSLDVKVPTEGHEAPSHLGIDEVGVLPCPFVAAHELQ